MSKHKVVSLKDIKSNFYVRKGINQDHVLMLAELYEAALMEAKDSVKASQAVVMIQLTDEGELVDGRHRKEAMELAGLTDIKVEVLPPMTHSQLVVAAARANYGGALPPTREDMIFTVEQLITRYGMTAKAIEDQMTMLPKSVIRKYINMANRRINDARLKLALSAITQGQSINQAAKNSGIKVEALQLAIEGKKPKTSMGVAQISSALTHYHKGYSNQIGRIVNRAIEDFRDGEISEDTIMAAINHYGHLLRRQFIRVEDWNNRIKAAKLGQTLPDKSDAYGFHVGEGEK